MMMVTKTVNVSVLIMEIGVAFKYTMESLFTYAQGSKEDYPVLVINITIIKAVDSMTLSSFLDVVFQTTYLNKIMIKILVHMRQEATLLLTQIGEEKPDMSSIYTTKFEDRKISFSYRKYISFTIQAVGTS